MDKTQVFQKIYYNHLGLSIYHLVYSFSEFTSTCISNFPHFVHGTGKPSSAPNLACNCSLLLA